MLLLPKLLADEDFNHKILVGLRRREPTLDVIAAGLTPLRGLPDGRVLEEAARSGRVVVSHDFKTMPGHFARFIESAQSPGLILVPQYLDIGAAINEILSIVCHYDESRLLNQTIYLPL